LARFDAPRREQDSEFKEKVVAINRVAKTVKGGRIFKFAALVVVGDGAGTVGIGMGKAGEVPEAIRKGIEDAKKNMVKISLKGSTIPHEVLGCYGAGRVLLKPAAPGTGVIAGGSARAVLEAAGIKDIRTKALRSTNPGNVIKATMQGLRSLRDANQIAAVRGKTVQEILGRKSPEKPAEQAEQKAAEKPVEKKAVEKVSEKPVEKKAAEKVSEKPVEKKAAEKVSEKPVEKKAAEKVSEKPVEKKASKKAAEKAPETAAE